MPTRIPAVGRALGVEHHEVVHHHVVAQVDLARGGAARRRGRRSTLRPHRAEQPAGRRARRSTRPSAPGHPRRGEHHQLVEDEAHEAAAADDQVLVLGEGRAARGRRAACWMAMSGARLHGLTIVDPFARRTVACRVCRPITSVVPRAPPGPRCSRPRAVARPRAAARPDRRRSPSRPEPSASAPPSPGGAVTGRYLLQINPAAACADAAAQLHVPDGRGRRRRRRRTAARRCSWSARRVALEAEFIDENNALRGGLGTTADGAAGDRALRAVDARHRLGRPSLRGADGRGEVRSGTHDGHHRLQPAERVRGHARHLRRARPHVHAERALMRTTRRRRSPPCSLAVPRRRRGAARPRERAFAPCLGPALDAFTRESRVPVAARGRRARSAPGRPSLVVGDDAELTRAARRRRRRRRAPRSTSGYVPWVAVVPARLARAVAHRDRGAGEVAVLGGPAGRACARVAGRAARLEVTRDAGALRAAPYALVPRSLAGPGQQRPPTCPRSSPSPPWSTARPREADARRLLAYLQTPRGPGRCSAEVLRRRSPRSPRLRRLRRTRCRSRTGGCPTARLRRNRYNDPNEVLGPPDAVNLGGRTSTAA